MSLTIVPNPSLARGDYDNVARALRSLAYVRAHASLKMDGPERYELSAAIALLRKITDNATPPEPPPIGGGSQEFDISELYAADLYGWYRYERDRPGNALDRSIMDAAEPDEYPGDPPETDVHPAPPWYLGLDGRLYTVPDFPAIDPQDIPY